MSPKQIAEKILKYEDKYETDTPDLAHAYLELENENYRIRCEKQSDLNTISQLQFDLEATEKVYRMNRQYVDDAKSEITKLKEENKDLKYLLDSINKHVIPGELDSSEAATDIIKRQREEIKELKGLFSVQIDMYDKIVALEKKLEITVKALKEIRLPFEDKTNYIDRAVRSQEKAWDCLSEIEAIKEIEGVK